MFTGIFTTTTNAKAGWSKSGACSNRRTSGVSSKGRKPLKAGESLMILWFMHHSYSKDAQEAQRLIEYINKRLRVLEGEGLMGQSLEPPPAPK